MAYNKIFFENPHTGAKKDAPVGFSWTTFFFGFFVPLVRGDWKWALLMILLAIFTLGFAMIYSWFAYNKHYIKDLIGHGYKAKSVQSGTADAISSRLGFNIPSM